MHEPYNQTGHITKQKHLLENWCDLLGIDLIISNLISL
jgi:hypothetical protein